MRFVGRLNSQKRADSCRHSAFNTSGLKAEMDDPLAGEWIDRDHPPAIVPDHQ
jgi:hypothetical protein